MRPALSAIVLSAILIGCAGTPEKMNRLRLGMTKGQVVKVMGKPYTSGAQGQTRMLKFWDADAKEDYYVRLVDGRVESFGRLGDFDSSVPKNDINLTVRKADPHP